MRHNASQSITYPTGISVQLNGASSILHEQHFFELAGDLTVEVEFLLSDEEAEKLIEPIKREQIRVFYAKVPAEFWMTDGKD